MKTTLSVLLGSVLLCLTASAQVADIQAVFETEKLDPQTSAQLQDFKARVMAAHPELEVVKVEGDVVKQAVLAPPPAAQTPVMAIFVKNLTKTKGMDDQVDGIRDRLAAEVAGLNFVVLDAAEIGAAFNRQKITTAEERAGLVNGLFTGGSVTRVAQMIGADYILTASIIGASQISRTAGDRPVTIYTLRMTTKVLDATTGGSVYGKNWTNKRPVPKGNEDDPLNLYDDLIDMWVQDTGADLAEASPRWRAPTKDTGALASFTVTTTLDSIFTSLEATVDATKPVKDELRVVAGGITVEVDGAAVGSSGGTFRVRPGLHQLRVSRQWMKPWVQTVNIADGAVFHVALELSEEGFRHYRNKEQLRAEVSLAYAEAAFRRGCRVNFNTEAWQRVTWAPDSSLKSISTSSSNVVQPVTDTVVQPVTPVPVPVPTAPAR
ncbi:MAG: PEGA domain-containing protein [Kiritimatiellae bacterium]|nr:PEGA domain-containing protein [Kiritimatiellia bacterium]